MVWSQCAIVSIIAYSHSNSNCTVYFFDSSWKPSAGTISELADDRSFSYYTFHAPISWSYIRSNTKQFWSPSSLHRGWRLITGIEHTIVGECEQYGGFCGR